MENTYLGILRGKMLPMEISAQMLLKGAEDKIFYLETKQMSGYTTKLTLRNTLKTAKESNPQDEQLSILLEELKTIKLSEDFSKASSDITAGRSIMDWLEISL